MTRHPIAAWYCSGSWNYQQDEEWKEAERKKREQEAPKPAQPPPPAPQKAIVVGRFDPLHRGHQFLIEAARGIAARTDVIVRVRPEDSVPGALRLAWCRELYGDDRVHALELAPPPDASPDEIAYWTHWADGVRALVPDADVLVASDPGAWRLADVMGIGFVLVDPHRLAVPISATQIRADPLACWDFLSPPARGHYARRVCLIGAEGSGKTTLARALAERLGTAWVPEQARVVAERRGGELREVDLPALFAAQAACEDALARQANRVLVCDTDLRSLVLWAERLFGRCADELRARAAAREPYLYVVPEPLGALDPARRAFAAACDDAARRSGSRTLWVIGSVEERVEQVIAAMR